MKSKKATTTIQKTPKCQDNNNHYSESYQNTQALEKQKEGLKIVAIPPKERRGKGFFRIVNLDGEIIADQLSDYAKAQVYFEMREEVSEDA